MNDESFVKTILEYKDYICKETQCSEISFVDKFDECYDVSDIEIDGYKFKIGIMEVVG